MEKEPQYTPSRQYDNLRDRYFEKKYGTILAVVVSLLVLGLLLAIANNS